MFTSAAGVSNPIYRLQTGWACQFSEPAAGRRAIIDVYLPGDIIGLDGPLRTRPVENVLAITSIETQVINSVNVLRELMASDCTALYAAWVLGRRQRRTDRLLNAMLCFDARGRLGMMVLDFYKRLSDRKLITAKSFNMPLTQQHIGKYLGLTVVHVNRVLRTLRDDRIASLERNWLTILDLERLILLAGDRGISGITSKRDPGNAASSEHRVDAGMLTQVPAL